MHTNLMWPPNYNQIKPTHTQNKKTNTATHVYVWKIICLCVDDDE